LPAEIPLPADLLGQETALRVLRSSFAADRVAGAYLLHGPAGVGRTLGAEIFAAALLCSSAKDGAACRACRSCRAFVAGTHPDFLSVSAETGPFFKDDAEAERARLDQFTRAARLSAKRGPRKTIPVRTLRRLLDFVSLASAFNGRKVALIDSFDEVEEAGTGTLLKSLEEAPRNTTFVVLAGSVESVPDTILSRCQRVRFRPLAPEVVRRLLASEGGSGAAALDDASRELLVRLGQGSAGRAIHAAELGVHQDGAGAAKALVDGADPSACDAAAAWLFHGTKDLAVARERVRELVAMTLLLARDRAAARDSAAILDALLPVLRQALESVDANVSPDLVLRALWARAARARALSL
jgi:DNA polymerase III delta prime subunit